MDLFPDLAARCCDEVRGLALELDRPLASTAIRGQRSATSSTMWVERMTTTLSPMPASRLRKRLRSSGSRPAVGSSTMISSGLPISAWAIPKRCRMPPEKPAIDLLRTAQRLVWLSRVSTTALRSLAGDALEDREVIEHRIGRDARIDAEILRQIAKRPAKAFGRRARRYRRTDRARGRRCSVATVRISVDLPAPFGPQQPVQPARDPRQTSSSATVPLA